MNNGEIFLKLRAELLEMPEYIKLDKIKHFQISLDIFNGNYIDLIALLDIHNNPENAMSFMGEDNRELRRAFQIHIIRLLHNYIASAISLVDHTRVHFNELYESENIFPDYQNEINQRFTSHPLSIFIKDLRQYFQHFQMPSITSNLYISRENPEMVISVKLEIENLKKFSGWKTKSNEYMSGFEKSIDLKTLIEDYHNHIQDFHSWFSSRQTQLHKNDQQKVDAHREKMRNNELKNFLSSIPNYDTIENFENDLFRYYYKEEVEKIRTEKLKKKRLKFILALLKKENMFNAKYETDIKEIYLTK